MADINKDLAELEAKIKAQEDKANRAMTISMAVTAILVLIMFGYFTYLGGMVREAMDPKGVASVASEQIRQQIPTVAREIQNSAKQMAPQLVDELITTAIKTEIPNARRRVEREIKQEAKTYLDKHEGLVLEGFDDIFENHRDRVNDMLTKLSTEQGQKEFEEDLYGILKESLDTQELRVELDSYAHTLKDVDELLKLIIEDEGALDAQHASLRNILAMIREVTNRTDVGKINLTD